MFFEFAKKKKEKKNRKKMSALSTLHQFFCFIFRLHQYYQYLYLSATKSASYYHMYDLLLHHNTTIHVRSIAFTVENPSFFFFNFITASHSRNQKNLYSYITSDYRACKIPLNTSMYRSSVSN